MCADRHQRWTASRAVQVLTEDYEGVAPLNAAIRTETELVSKMETQSAGTGARSTGRDGMHAFTSTHAAVLAASAGASPSRDVLEGVITFMDNLAKHSHPTLYVLVQKQPHETFNFIKKYLQDKYYCYCLCEMQCTAGPGDCEALWLERDDGMACAVMACRHPVMHKGEPYRAKVTSVTQFVKTMKPVLKAASIALKAGAIAAKCDVEACMHHTPRPQMLWRAGAGPVAADPQGVGHHRAPLCTDTRPGPGTAGQGTGGGRYPCDESCGRAGTGRRGAGGGGAEWSAGQCPHAPRLAAGRRARAAVQAVRHAGRAQGVCGVLVLRARHGCSRR